MATQDAFEVKFTSREVSAWGGLALLKRMLDGMDFKAAMQSWGLPEPGSNRGYAPEQLIEQMIVSIWCGAARFVHADITRLDTTLQRLFGWGRVAGHKAIVRLFQRFDQGSAARVQTSSYQWLFNKLGLARHTGRGLQRADPLGLANTGGSQGLQPETPRTGQPPSTAGLCGRLALGGQFLAAPRQHQFIKQRAGLH